MFLASFLSTHLLSYFAVCIVLLAEASSFSQTKLTYYVNLRVVQHLLYLMCEISSSETHHNTHSMVSRFHLRNKKSSEEPLYSMSGGSFLSWQQ
ncbi:hypothetical protein V8C42DRAFT_117924 [Trichoderma barbatum]